MNVSPAARPEHSMRSRRGPWTENGQLYYGVLLAALKHGVDPEDRTEVHMTVTEARHLAEILTNLINAAEVAVHY